ncbi:MAG: ROK family protein [Anaerolineae bacterium]
MSSVAGKGRSAVLGVDIGGTKVAVAPVDEAGNVLADALVEASRTDDTSSFLAGLEATIRRALTEFADFQPRAIGMACAGTVNGEQGSVVTSPNLPLKRVALADAMETVLDLPVILENDANAAAWAEAMVGAAAGYRYVVMLTLGTGVGGGLILDGGLYRGTGGGAAELGHTIICAGGELCACGARGCLEQYASGTALERYGRARAGSSEDDPDGVLARLRDQGRLDGEAVSELARAGHPGALACVEELAGWLGLGMVGLANTFNPEIIVIGGGVSDLGDLILQPAEKILRATALPPNGEAKVVKASLGNIAGLVGGGLIAWKALP